jgi:hypothetical protein
MKKLLIFFCLLPLLLLFQNFSAPVEEGYDIFILAGQSNAAFAGKGPFSDPAGNSKDHLIFQIGRSGLDNGKIVPAQDKLQHWIYNPKNRTISIGFGMSFAREYAKTSLASGRKILLIPGSFSGSSILSWDRKVDFPGDNSTIYTDLMSRVRIAMRLPGNNVIKGVLWHQGETDVVLIHGANASPPVALKVPVPPLGEQKFVQPQLNLMSSKEKYEDRLVDLIKRLRSDLNDPFLPILIGEFSEKWTVLPTLEKGRNAVKESLEDVKHAISERIDVVRVVSARGLATNDDIGVIEKNIHFSAQGQVDLGKNYYSVWQSLEKEMEPFRGLFLYGPGIFYSNGKAFCAFRNLESFKQHTGRSSSTGIPRKFIHPTATGLTNQGFCQ